MRHPYEKFIRLELVSLCLAVLTGIIVLIKGFIFLAIFVIYLIAFGLCFEAMVEYHTHNQNKAFKHFIQATLLIIFMSYIVFYL
ncbi:hypothetical protein [Virgibacillus sp. DJP39]|uniref:hypothetical protein n=1 Tax=Virgibacillus sp. DJP39 TaxID=3409790 RepID=UPI003BB5B308